MSFSFVAFLAFSYDAAPAGHKPKRDKPKQKINMKKTLLTALALVLSFTANAKDLVDYVNPYIGNISHLLVPTFATVQLPNSLLRVYPERADYTTELVKGLPVVVTSHRESSAFRISPSQQTAPTPVNAMNYDHERLTPYSFDLELADNTMRARFAPSHQSAVYELQFYDTSKPAFVTVQSDEGSIEAGQGFISGWQKLSDNMKIYLYLEYEGKPEAVGVLRNGAVDTQSARSEGRDACIALRYAKGTAKVGLRYGVSLISVEQARKNLRREINTYDVDAVAAKGRAVWNEALSRMQVEGGTEDQKTVFYTSYYRTLERPVCLSEDGRYFSGFDGKVHSDNGSPFYSDDWIWDTYRAAHPLRIILQPREEEDIVNSYLRMAEQMGTDWMPTFPGITGDSRRMNSNHGVAMVADALWKGLKVDAQKGFEYSRKAIEEKTLAPWSGAPANEISSFYKTHGYIPGLREGEKETDPTVSGFEKRQSVAVTLGTSYDEWCLSRIAQFRGDKANAKKYLELSYNYRNLFNPQTSFFHPKDKEGQFIEPFDYRFSGGTGVRDYYDENNGWTYRWDVQHNVADLISLMGGREKFVDNLDKMYAEPMGRGKREFYWQLPDQTGNIGQFTMANEPSLHIPYLYNYGGAPWKTQKRVRQVLSTWFRNDVMGIPGDEDGGGLTSFVVFSSMGFYPVTPGLPVYNIGSPVFSKVQVKVGNGKTFTIIANDCSEDNKYIQRATLNGKELDKPWFTHDDVVNGGTLVLYMGNHPNKSWGAAPTAAPPSAGAK